MFKISYDKVLIVKWRKDIIMFTKKTFSPYHILFSRQLNLLDFECEKPLENCLNRQSKNGNIELSGNHMLLYAEKVYNYAKACLNDYSNYFSNHLYTQPKLFTILALKMYSKMTYREIIEWMQLSDKLLKFLRLKTVPHYTTIQKFFKRISETSFKELNKKILSKFTLTGGNIALDGSGFTNDYADKYFAKIRRKERKSYVKNHIAINVNTQLILDYQVQRGPRHDTHFAKQSIRNIKIYKPHYIIADKAYDTEPIRKCINEEVGAFDQIPLKTRAKNGHYRTNSPTIFRPKIYRKRNNIECVFSVVKRKFNGTNHSRSLKLSNKETKLKNTFYNFYRSTKIPQK